MQPRTRRQRDVLDIITRYIENNGHLPSYATIARHLGVRSKAGVAKHVLALESQGLIRRRSDVGKFNLQLCAEENAASGSRVVEWLARPGRSPAEGEPFLVPRFFLGSYADAELFAVRAEDDALSRRGICESDLVIFERRSFAREGTVVAAEIRGKLVVLRSYHREGAYVSLRSDDGGDEYDNIRTAADAVEILGIYRCLLRPPA